MNNTLYIVTGVRVNEDNSIDVKILGVFKYKDNATGLRNQLQKDYYNYEGWDINIETLETDLI